MSHRHHPNVEAGDPRQAVLYDQCPSCEFHAGQGGLSLDPDLFARAWNQMIRVERNIGAYRTDAEAKLCRSLYHVALLMDRHPGIRINPWLFLDAEDDAYEDE